jgi:hypothetical protein
LFLEGEDALAFVGEDLGLILKVTWVQADQQLRGFGQRIGRNQFRQRFDVGIVRREVDERAGVRN